MAGEWSDLENDLIVASYFAMLRHERAGERFNKAAFRRALQPLLNARGEPSIEFKHRNISAVLLGLGEDWIEGYLPAERFQLSLLDAVLRWLDRHPEWSAPWPAQQQGVRARAFHEPEALYVGPAPTYSNAPSPLDPVALQLIARRIDAADRDARNRALGRAGEALVVERERALLRQYGRDDLARRVIWSAQDEGDGLGYDIASFEPDGAPRLIEVKTTNGWDRTPFHITRTELAAADRHRDSWRLLRLWNFNRAPKAFELAPPLERHVALTATTFLASVG